MKDPIKSYKKEIERIGSLTKLLVLITIIMGLTGIFFSIYINSARAEPKEWVLWCDSELVELEINGNLVSKERSVTRFVIEPQQNQERVLVYLKFKSEQEPRVAVLDAFEGTHKDSKGERMSSWSGVGKKGTYALTVGGTFKEPNAVFSSYIKDRDGNSLLTVGGSCEWQPRK